MGTIQGKRPNRRVFNPFLTQKGTIALYYLVSKRSRSRDVESDENSI